MTSMLRAMKTSRGLSMQLGGRVLGQHEQTIGLISSNTKMERKKPYILFQNKEKSKIKIEKR